LTDRYRSTLFLTREELASAGGHVDLERDTTGSMVFDTTGHRG
jgi:hypothetical protein